MKHIIKALEIFDAAPINCADVASILPMSYDRVIIVTEEGDRYAVTISENDVTFIS